MRYVIVLTSYLLSSYVPVIKAEVLQIYHIYTIKDHSIFQNYAFVYFVIFNLNSITAQ